MGERDIWEVCNQLGGYVGPDTEERLARFLLREAKAAENLANEIARLRAEVERLTQSRDGYAAQSAARARECDRIRAEERERAAQIADVQSVLFEKQAAHTEDTLVHDALVMASDACELVACEIRHAGKDGGAG